MGALGRAVNIPLGLPFQGMDLQTPLADLPMSKAPYIENFSLDGQSLKVRYGTGIFSTVASAAEFDRIEALYTYTNSSGVEILFGAMSSSAVTAGIYNFTSAAATLAQADAGTIAGGSFIQFRNRLYWLGTANPAVYDGATWGAVGFTGPTLSNILDGCSYKNRFYLLENLSFTVWYGNTDAISGAMTSLDLSSLFYKGGFLKAVLPITYAGSSSQSYLAFISSEGEVLIYSGSYPGSSTWEIIAKFEIGKVVGIAAGRYKKSYIQYQGDIYMPTVLGFMSIKGMLQSLQQSSEYQPLSQPINVLWKKLFRTSTVQVLGINSKYFSRTGCFYISVNAEVVRTNNNLSETASTSTVRTVFVYNIQNNAWGVYYYGNARPDILCIAETSSKLVVGTNRYGRAVEIEKIGSYQDEIIEVPTAGTYATIQASILSAALSSNRDNGSRQKFNSLELQAYINAGSASNPVECYLVENFGKVSGTTKPVIREDEFNSIPLNVGSTREYIQYNLTVKTNSSSGDPTVLYNLNALMEQGGYR